MTDIRRGRGYRYEKSIVDRLNACRGWRAWRLGGTQIELPDILAVHNETKTLLVIEAKTGGGNLLYVPAHQTRRVLQWCNNLAAYKDQYAICAFKFHNSDNKKLRPMEYFFSFHIDRDYRCNRRGYFEHKIHPSDDLNSADHGCWHQYALWSDNFVMPWEALN